MMFLAYATAQAVMPTELWTTWWATVADDRAHAENHDGMWGALGVWYQERTPSLDAEGQMWSGIPAS